MSYTQTELNEKFSAEELLDLSMDEIPTAGFKVAPEAVYNGDATASVETRNDKQWIDVNVVLTDVVEFIQGPDKETLEELQDADGNIDTPEYIRFSYTVDGKGLPNFKKDFGPIISEVLGKKEFSPREGIDALAGISIQFTHTLYRKVDKENPTAEVKKYSNIRNAQLLTAEA